MLRVGDTMIFNLMERRGVLNNGDSINYGMGQFIGNYNGLYTIDHSGSDAGFRSHLLRFPDHRLSIIVLANDASLDAGALAFKIADIYFGTEKREDSSATDKPVPMTTGHALDSDPQTLMKYVGKFELPRALFMDFAVEDKHLTVNATGQGKFKLQQISAEVFKINGVNGTIVFKTIPQGEFDSIEFEINGTKMQGKRVRAKEIPDGIMREYEGKFYSRELDVSYSIVYDKGKLIAKNKRSGDTHLSPISKDDFSGSQWFMGTVKFKRNSKHVITGLTVSSDRVVNLFFEKIY